MIHKNQLKLSSNEFKDIVLPEINKANINQQDYNGNTPLHYACKRQDKNIMKFLIHHGANPNIENNESKVLLIYYIYNVFNDSIQMIGNNDDNMIKEFIEHGMETNKMVVEGSTLLHFACDIYNHKLVEYSVAFGIDIDCVDEDGYTPLLYTMNKLNKNGFYNNYKDTESILDMIKCLISHGANVNQEYGGKWTPFFHLCHSYRTDKILHKKNKVLELIKCFIDHGANINKRYNGEQTILHLFM